MADNTNDTSSYGHKLGQLIGDWFEEYFVLPLLFSTAKELKLYLDHRFLSRAVRGDKITWKDEDGNTVDYDFVFELGGTDQILGIPVAFFECFWRRGSRHSKDKARDDSTKLRPMRETYPTARFLGILAAGDFTKPAKVYVENSEIDLFYVPKSKVVQAFQENDLVMDYEDKAPETEKASIAKTFSDLFTERKKCDVATTLTALVGRPAIQLYSQRILGRLSAQPQEIRLVLRHESSPISFPSVYDVTRFLSNPTFEMKNPQKSYVYQITYNDAFEFSRHVDNIEDLLKLHAQVHKLNDHLNQLL